MRSGALIGAHIRLEPLERSHVDALLAASAEDPALYRWSPVPVDLAAARAYVETACSWRDAGVAVPFLIVRSDGRAIGSTRFWNIEKWAWPVSADRRSEAAADGCEIGYTWLAASAIRSAANTEAKLLMLAHAFEVWNVLRVCFHTDVRNERSAAALERLGARFEGVLRAHRLAADAVPRDSKRYSILAEEWPGVKNRLQDRLAMGAAQNG
jgi:RimJ/RimL family protein N-acetyltransferase